MSNSKQQNSSSSNDTITCEWGITRDDEAIFWQYATDDELEAMGLTDAELAAYGIDRDSDVGADEIG